MRRCSVRHQALRGTLPAATYCWPCWPLVGGCTAPAPPSPVRVPPHQCTCTYAQVHVHASHSGAPMLQLGLPSCDRGCQSSVGLLISESDWTAADVAPGTEEVPSHFAGSHTLRYCSIQCLLGWQAQFASCGRQWQGCRWAARKSRLLHSPPHSCCQRCGEYVGETGSEAVFR